MSRITKGIIITGTIGLFILMTVGVVSAIMSVDENVEKIQKTEQVKEKLENKVKQEKEESKPKDTNPEYRSAYMSTCDPDGTNTVFCTCTYDYMLDKYGIDKMIEFGSEANEDEMIDIVWEATLDCYEQI